MAVPVTEGDTSTGLEREFLPVAKIPVLPTSLLASSCLKWPPVSGR